jgi:endonuclease G
MKTFIAIFCLLISSVTFADCGQLLPFGYPKVSQVDTTVLCRIAYVVKHDNVKKVPIYAAEYLLKENLENTVPRIDAFKADPSLMVGRRSELTDYDKKYDRGHMVPFEDSARNSAAGMQSFYLSNICPQDLHLNRGMWKKLEISTRTWAKESAYGVYVITGPIFYGIPPTIGANKVAVPQKFYKIIIDTTSNQGIAFIIPNTPPMAGKKLIDYAVTIHDVEKATNINFTPNIPLESLQIKGFIGTQFKIKSK